MALSRTRYTLFLTVGLLILVSSILIDKLKYPDLHEISIAISVTIISVSLLDFLFHLAGGNPIQHQIKDLSTEIQRLSTTIDVIENARRIGVNEMHDCTGNYGGKLQWFKIMQDAKASMDLMGRSLYEWIRAPEFNEIILKKINNDNIKFRWLIMSPNNRHLEQLEEDGELIGESIEKKIIPVCSRLKIIRDQLSMDKKNLLEIRTFSHVPLYCSLLRVDDRYFVTPYLHSVASRNSPLLVLQGPTSPWAITYSREFEQLWASAEPLG